MEIERRIGKNSIPKKLSFYLSAKQIHGARIMRKFGWRLQFIRRPVFSNVTPVFRNIHDDSWGILEIDGVLKLSSELKIRKIHEERPNEHASDELPTEIVISDTKRGRYGYPAIFNNYFLD